MKDFLKRVYSDFRTQEENWCEISNSQFVPNGLSQKIYGGYDKEYFEQFYLLKYMPLYIAEYVEIYEDFLKEYDKDTLRVLSVGVGAGLDYYSLLGVLENREDIEMDYMGIDLVDWKYRDEEIDFEEVDLKNITENDRVMDFISDGVDVIIFPKSIIEIRSSQRRDFTSVVGKDAFSVLCDVLIEHNIEDVWFLNSYIKTYKEVSGMREFSQIVNKLQAAGYRIVDGLDDTEYYESHNGSSVNYPFDYRSTWQHDLHNYCQRECGEEQSEKCSLAQNPMLRKSHIAFGITNFKKVA